MEEIATSRRRKIVTAPPPRFSLTPEESAQQRGPGPEILRRLLLGFMTALIVARPLVLGEDPGVSSRLTDGSSLVLSLLWLVAAVGWAVWRLWSRRGAWYGGMVEAGLAAVVAIVFASATWSASYRHPAFLIAWEWLILLVAFSLVRQLARTAAENQRLLAVVLASGVSLSAYAIYQYYVEMPTLREFRAGMVEEARQKLFTQGGDVGGFDRDQSAEAKRLAENNVYATFAHPNAFAGYLALLFPAAVTAAFLCWRQTRLSWHTVLISVTAILMAVGLWLTHSRGAILASIIVIYVVAAAHVLQLDQVIRSRIILRLLVAQAVFGILLAFILPHVPKGAAKPAVDPARQSFEKRLEYWTATWKMITDSRYPEHFWLGVGPGNFNRFYPRYMSETAHEYLLDPHNFALEMWATTGFFGMLALVATLTLLFWKLARVARPQSSKGVLAPPSETTPFADSGRATQISTDGSAPRWEFYIGGMMGMIGGFLLSSWPASNDPATQAEFIISGVVAGSRAIVWFAAFAIFESVPWTRGLMRSAIAAGVIALLLNLCVSGGIALPSVALPLWFMAALALSTIPTPPKWNARTWVGVVLPLPLLTALCLYYLLVAFIPVTSSLASLNAASQNYTRWTESYDPAWQLARKEDGDPGQRMAVLNRNRQFLDRVILPRLHNAHQSDPTSIVPLIDLATWSGEKWKLSPDMNTRMVAAGYAHTAAERDPEGREAYLAQARLNTLFAGLAQTGSHQLYGLAADALGQAVTRDPTSAPLRFKFAESLFKAERRAEARLQAEQALRLDSISSESTRKLTQRERTQVQAWLGN